MKAAETVAIAAWQAGYPLSFMVTVTWHNLRHLGKGHKHNVLGLPEPKRRDTLFQRLRRVLREVLGFPAYWVWAKAEGSQVGVHLHVYLFWPEDHTHHLIRVLEKVTGDPAHPQWADDAEDVVSEAHSHGWQVKRNLYGYHGSLRGADYVARQEEHHGRALPGKCFGTTMPKAA
ncbi:hypothetical protein [Pseudooceanicola sp. MF1-13]|uniref:hypothetical protein n=1 Tax=Pseudooceanicola sp. MF1-13 TaxID=3379095 RepID=UPI003891570A